MFSFSTFFILLIFFIISICFIYIFVLHSNLKNKEKKNPEAEKT